MKKLKIQKITLRHLGAMGAADLRTIRGGVDPSKVDNCAALDPSKIDNCAIGGAP